MSNAADILQGLGGKDNIDLLESCITRLRVQVKDVDKLDEDALHMDGVYGVVVSGHVVQVVVGPVAEQLTEEMQTLL